MAKELFSAKGYARTLISDVAAAAGFSDALVIKHFKTKDLLYEMALSDSLASITYSPGRKTLPSRSATLVAHYDDANVIQALSMLVQSVGDATAHRSALRLFEKYILSPLEEDAPAGNASVLAEAASAIILGLATLRLLSPVRFTSAAHNESLASLLSQALEQLNQSGDNVVENRSAQSRSRHGGRRPRARRLR